MKIVSSLLLLPTASAIADLLPTFDFCPISDVLPGVTCACETTILPPKFTSACSTDFEDCEPILQSLCGDATLTTTFDLLRIFELNFPLTAEACYEDITVFDNSIPFFNEICFEFITPIFSFLTGGLVGSDSAADKAPKSYSMCNAMADGELCDYCNVCDDGLGGVGVMFKCGEVESTECTTISTKSLPTSMKGAVGVDSIVPLKVDATD